MRRLASSTLAGVSRLAAPRWSPAPHSEGHQRGPMGVSGPSSFVGFSAGLCAGPLQGTSDRPRASRTGSVCLRVMAVLLTFGRIGCYSDREEQLLKERPMLPIHIVLHPTDFSDRSRNALHLACALARDYSARLIVLHVVTAPPLAYGEGAVPPDPDLLCQDATAHLDALEIPDASIAVERRVEEGDSVTEILRVARESNADLIVMGTHGRTGLARLLMGSVAEQIVRKASCPVLTVTSPFPLSAPVSPVAAVMPAGAV